MWSTWGHVLYLGGAVVIFEDFRFFVLLLLRAIYKWVASPFLFTYLFFFLAVCSPLCACVLVCVYVRACVSMSCVCVYVHVCACMSVCPPPASSRWQALGVIPPPTHRAHLRASGSPHPTLSHTCLMSRHTVTCLTLLTHTQASLASQSPYNHPHCTVCATGSHTGVAATSLASQSSYNHPHCTVCHWFTHRGGCHQSGQPVLLQPPPTHCLLVCCCHQPRR